MLRRGIQQSHIYAAAETSGTALGRRSCSGSCVYPNFPEQSCLDRTRPDSAKRKIRAAGRARRQRGSAPRADPPTDEESINRMEGFFLP